MYDCHFKFLATNRAGTLKGLKEQMYDQTKDIKLAQMAAGHTTSAMTLRYYVKDRETISKAAAVVDRAYSA